MTSDQNQICYVSMPFGQKADPMSARTIDFESVYQGLIRPAIEAAGVTAVRGDELGGAVVLRSVLETILRCDVFVADLTTGNPNVMYELGIRHALRRSVTVLIMEQETRVPFDLTFARLLRYQTGPAGRPAPDQPGFRESLAAAIREGLARVTEDSPVYAFFPELSVQLPPTLAVSPRVRSPRDPGQSKDPHTFIASMRKLRDQSAWDDIVRMADSAPAEVANAPEVVQLLALALNRRRGSARDQERAIDVLIALISETGGDGETYGLLGRIYKDRSENLREKGDVDGARTNLDLAIAAYLRGFEREPNNIYPGVNAATLLFLRGDDEARERAMQLLPLVRQAVQANLSEGQVDYWTLATAMELAAMAGEWNEVEDLARRLLSVPAHGWMLETTARNLDILQTAAPGRAGNDRLKAIVAALRAGAAGTSR